jgi:hypothetical protein
VPARSFAAHSGLRAKDASLYPRDRQTIAGDATSKPPPRLQPDEKFRRRNFISVCNRAFKLLAVIILAGLIAACLPSAHAAPEKSRTRNGTFATSDGKSGTASGTVTRAKGETKRSGTWTNQNGQTGSRSAERKFDAASGTGTINTTATRADGLTATRDGNFTKNADGSLSADGTTTGFNGKSANYTTTTSKTENGTTTTGTLTGPNNKTATINSSTNRTDGLISKDTTVVGPKGNSIEPVTATQLNGNGTATRTIEVTKPDGSKETRTETFTHIRQKP